MVLRFDQITKIERGGLFFDDGGTEKRIDLQTSADRWWEIHHKPRFGDAVLRRKKKNRYAGVKEFGGVSDVRYFKLFDETEEYCFQICLAEHNPAEILPILQDINARINKEGYWLYDWA